MCAVFFAFLQNPLLKLACGILMALIVFGRERGLARITLIFFAVSASFGGAVYAVSMLRGDPGGIRLSARTLIISFAVCYAVFSVVFKRLGRASVSANTAAVTLTLGDRSLTLTALRDTGNSLSDPVTGAPVVLIERGDALKLLPPDAARLFKTHTDDAASLVLEAEKTGVPLRLIPYSAVGVKSGLLPAFRTDSAQIDGKNIKGLFAAVSPTVLSDGGGYSALIGGTV